jgi:two-component system sensor histidine kinase ChiS
VRYAKKYLQENPLNEQADEARIAAYNNNKKFIDNVENYLTTLDSTKLDLSLLTPETAQAMLQADPALLRYAEEAKDAIKNGKMYISNANDFYTVYIPIQFSSVTNPWSVAVSIPMTKILDNANNIRNYVVVVSIIAICIIAFILYLISKSVTKPILILSDTAKILGEGNFDIEVPLVQRNDEIGYLSHAFKFMAEKINNLIKEMQQYAKALEEKNTNLNRLNELKDEFLANTSHELRTPIHGIIGIVESMIDGATGQLSIEQKYNLAIVANSGKRLSNMINDILDFTKLKNQEIILQIKPVDLKTIIDTVLVLSKPLIKGKDLTLINEIESSFIAISADENRIQQILYNLIGNAVKFTEKGTIRVSAERMQDLVAVSVTDTGIGIPEDKFERIFESFEQADGSTARKYGGTGLGLSVTKKLVELHGGRINVESKVGEGSRFTFTVPISDIKISDIALSEINSSIIDIENFIVDNIAENIDGYAEKTEGVRRILVVDDEPVNIQVLSNLLSIRHYSVSKAYNGQEALDLIDNGEIFDLILLDIMMPRMSGYEVCRRLREKFSLFDLPILMLTAKNQVQDVVLGFQAGANDYIQKPFDKEELLARVQTLLDLKNAVSGAMVASEAKNAFLANMSHEIRTPLNAVIGLTRLMLNTPLDGKQRDYTEKMHRAAAALLGIVNDILDFSKADAGHMSLECRPFDIRKIFDDMAVFFQERSSAAGVGISFSLDPSIPAALEGDPLRLQQIFINLIDNAFKFTERGAITVRAEAIRRDSRGVAVNFAVEDTGIGMSREQTDRIFSAFTQADNSVTRRYGGAGLGLTITRQIVELMGGEISVSSEEGKGSIFSFSCVFPLAGDAAAAEEALQGEGAPDEHGVENAMLRGLRVLLVEDNEINAEIACELLAAVDIDVTTAQNGQEALDALARERRTDGSRPFDLVLMDMQMPVMDGYEATKIILNMPEYRDMPILAMTAHVFAQEKEHCLALGMKGHLSKPIDVEALYQALRDVVSSLAPPRAPGV